MKFFCTRSTTTLRFWLTISYGNQRSMMISRGLGGKGGKRSIITARGGAGSGGRCLEEEKFVFHREVTRKCVYRVITFVAREDGSGGGFSRITSGGGVFGGVGRSENRKLDFTVERRGQFTFDNKWW